jgi:hypothetical protein
LLVLAVSLPAVLLLLLSSFVVVLLPHQPGRLLLLLLANVVDGEVAGNMGEDCVARCWWGCWCCWRGRVLRKLGLHGESGCHVCCCCCCCCCGGGDDEGARTGDEESGEEMAGRWVRPPPPPKENVGGVWGAIMANMAVWR